MARVHLIYFDIDTGYYPGFHHGLAYLIGALRADGHSVILSHLADEKDFFRLKNIWRRKVPNLIGLSFTTNQKKFVRRFFQKMKLPQSLVIAGGVHATLVREEVLEDFPQVNGICIGEGEYSLRELCRRLDKKEKYLDTPSFYWRTKTGVLKNPVMPLLDIDTLPFPDYSLFDYTKIIRDNGESFYMMLSRGCPYSCHYCCNHVIREVYPNKFKYVRFVSPRRAIDIIKHNLALYPQAQKILFSDDTFTINKAWLTEFCQLYKEEIGLPFLCNARVETINDEVAGSLKMAGCAMLGFGIESGSAWLRKYILNRHHSNELIKKAFAIVRKHRLKTYVFNMVGLPFESKNMAEETWKLNQELQPDIGRVFYFYPFPGTQLYQLCREYGFLPADLENVSGYLEAPALKEIFILHADTRALFQKLHVYLTMRIIFSKLGIPLPLEAYLVKLMLLFRQPIFWLMAPHDSTNTLKRFKGWAYRLLLKHLE
ncbi:MAG: B12-binding domain-containing radical SAM protein [Patescibacteria group bacterium]